MYRSTRKTRCFDSATGWPTNSRAKDGVESESVTLLATMHRARHHLVCVRTQQFAPVLIGVIGGDRSIAIPAAISRLTTLDQTWTFFSLARFAGNR
jgi:hypothetical protein